MSEAAENPKPQTTPEQEPAILDVHPPHEPVHGWRDFSLHLATITIGLLIAISLEQTVEFFHHRHLVHEARENIHHEIELNRAAARQNGLHVQANAGNMKGNVEKARALRSNAHALDNNAMHFTFSWEGFQESAWHSARDTGALSYMPTDEVQRYADSYEEQEIVDREAVSIFTTQSEIAAPFIMENDPSAMSTAEIQTLMHDSAITYLRLLTLKELLGELQKSYEETLHQP